MYRAFLSKELQRQRYNEVTEHDEGKKFTIIPDATLSLSDALKLIHRKPEVEYCRAERYAFSAGSQG